MKANALFIALVLLLPGEILFGGQKKTVASWLKKKHAQLAAVENPASIRKVALNQSEEPNGDGFFRMHVKKGYIEFADGSWALLTSHSAHAEDGLPDISLIRTSSGEYYTNLGHCCLPLLLFSKTRVISLEGFLKTTGKGPKAKPTPWIKYNREDGADQPATAPESRPEGEKKPKSKSEARPQ